MSSAGGCGGGQGTEALLLMLFLWLGLGGFVVQGEAPTKTRGELVYLQFCILKPGRSDAVKSAVSV